MNYNMVGHISYSKATPKDKEAVTKQHALLYEDDDTKTAEDIASDVRTALNNGLVWVANVEGEIAGYVLCRLFDADQRYFPNSIFIDGLFVQEHYRKKGIGKTLMMKVLKENYPKQYTYFSITHDPASVHLTDFYTSLGFARKGVTSAGNIMLTKLRDVRNPNA